MKIRDLKKRIPRTLELLRIYSIHSKICMLWLVRTLSPLKQNCHLRNSTYLAFMTVALKCRKLPIIIRTFKDPHFTLELLKAMWMPLITTAQLHSTFLKTYINIKHSTSVSNESPLRSALFAFSSINFSVQINTLYLPKEDLIFRCSAISNEHLNHSYS